MTSLPTWRGWGEEVILPADAAPGPDFICIGAQKGATRWLYDQLLFHPQFWMPPIKELHYFDTAKNGIQTARRLKESIDNGLEQFNQQREKALTRPLTQRDVEFVEKFLALSQPPIDIDGYARLFDGKGDLLTGDVTPGYSVLRNKRIKMIARRFPSVRIIFLAREPVERLWSQLGMLAHQGKVPSKLDAETVVELAKTKTVTARSFPSEIVSRWRRFIPQDRFGVFFLDDLRKDAGDMRRRVLQFLGADPGLPSGDLPPGFNRKSSLPKLPMTDEIKSALVKHFAEELRTCARVLGGPAKAWPARYGL